MGRAAAPVILPTPRWLSNRVAVWQRRSELEHWYIRLEFVDHIGGRSRNAIQAAEMTWAEGYHDAVLRVSNEWYCTANERDVDWRLAHEMYHLITAPLWDLLKHIGSARAEEERNAERFASVLMRAYRRKKILNGD